MVKPIAVEVEVVRQAEGSLQPVLATVSGRGLTSQDSVGEGLAAVLARSASSSALEPMQKKGATPSRISAPASMRTPGSSGSSLPGKADGGKALSSGAARPKRPATPSLAGLESACEAAMVSLAAGQTAPADASGTASKLLEQLAALQSTLATARAGEGGLFELDADDAVWCQLPGSPSEIRAAGESARGVLGPREVEYFVTTALKGRAMVPGAQRTASDRAPWRGKRSVMDNEDPHADQRSLKKSGPPATLKE